MSPFQMLQSALRDKTYVNNRAKPYTTNMPYRGRQGGKRYTYLASPQARCKIGVSLEGIAWSGMASKAKMQTRLRDVSEGGFKPTLLARLDRLALIDAVYKADLPDFAS